ANRRPDTTTAVANPHARPASPPPDLRQAARRSSRHPVSAKHGRRRMKFETFKAGTWQRRERYKSFEPVPVNHDWVWEDATINTLLESANRALGELNAFSLIVPD